MTRRGGRVSAIIKLITRDGMSCRQACDDLPASTASFHHKVMRDAGLIHSEKRGVEVINTVRKADLDQRFPGLLDAILDHHEANK